MITKRTAQRIAAAAFNVEYGVMPTSSTIKINEMNDDGTEIKFSIRGNHYVFKSEIRKVKNPNDSALIDRAVFVGRGTLTKIVKEPNKDELSLFYLGFGEKDN